LLSKKLVEYKFQFPEVWTRWTGLDKEWNDDIGLINYSDVGESGALFVRLFTPISLFVVAMLQLKFFHDPWMAMMTRTSEDRGEVQVDRGTVQLLGQEMDRNYVSQMLELDASLSARISDFVNRAIELIWRITEIHITKIVFIIVTIFAANNICALYVPLVIAGMVVAIIALALQSVVVYRQRHSRQMQGLPESSSIGTLALSSKSYVVTLLEKWEKKKRVFPSLNMDDFDLDLVHAMQFLVDFGFYKFGFELCMIMMAINAWVRMDMLAAVMCIWIGLFALNKRFSLAYPWDHVFGEPSSSTKNVNFDIWIGLSNYSISWPAENLVADFFLLLLASCQLSVFRCEGTENDSIFDNDDYDLKPNNPRYDFMDSQR
uniref:PRT_C domain-containing protein n=1 Tax=Angiostrongylus cantonensis TaxID=6313 RepID=A0A0K0D0A4_ANGCA